MDFFSRMMSFGEKLGRKKIKSEPSSECIRIYELQDELNALLKGTNYVARSEYAEITPAYKEIVEFFRVLQNSKMLKSYCAQNGITEGEVLKIIDLYDHLGEIIDVANDEYIKSQMLSEKEYLDNILKEVDPVIVLDEDQRRVILTDEDYCLVIAGAGAGKTTTVAAKVKYLVEKKGIEPRDILVISFTNKAVGELREKINKDLRIDCPIATFHSTGNAILRINDPEPLNIFDGSKLYFLLQDYFKQSILTNEALVNNLIMFFASYFEAPYEGADLNEFFNKTAKANYTTMRSELDEFRREVIDARTKKNVTIQNEVLRSYQEVQIANFLYLNNIDYEYEPIYPYNITFSRKPYTPDFIIKQGDKVAYIEHFGITEDGKNNRYTAEELVRYKNSVNDKVKLHREHGTTLIYTFSEFNDKRSLLKHLQEKLEAAGFELTPRSNKEVMDKLIASEESRYVRKLVNLICRFITNFKTNGFDVDEFDRMYHSTTNVRSRLFLNICQDCYLEYQRYLKENSAVDFEDMINESARVLRQVKEMKEKLHFKYIMRYQNHVASAIKPSIYETPYIGKDAIRVQLEQAKNQSKQIKEQLSEKQSILMRLEELQKPLSIEDDTDIKYRMDVLQDLKHNEQEIKNCKSNIATLEKNQGMIMKQIQVNKLEEIISEMDAKISEMNKKVGRFEESIANTKGILVEKQAEFLAKNASYLELGSGQAERVILWNTEYEKQTQDKSYETFRDNYSRRRKANQTTIENNMDQMKQWMVDYKTAHDFGAAATEEGYPEFELEYIKLKDSELLSYEEKVENARQSAESEFREQFLSKLQENMKNAQNEFKDLNKALKDITFSNEKYEFLFMPSKNYRHYYEMIMDDFNAMQGESIFSGLFHQNHKEVIDELFEKLALDNENNAKALDEFTDYRTYMDYDIKILHSDDTYSLYSKVCEEKSGGETQTPFYVTVAASFVQLYKNGIGGDAIGLVLFDEAFNNMDDERIGGVLEFLQRLPLQILIAAPPDKIQYISPFVEETILVMTDEKVSYTERYFNGAIQ